MAQNNNKTVAFIPVRLTSTRMPEKHLKAIGPKSVISWVIHQLKGAREIDEIVICAPNEPETEKLRPTAKAEGVKLYVYDGGADDVVGRLTKAAETFEADICVLASGDCPLLCPATIDSMARLLKENPSAGHAAFTPVNNNLPIHEGIVISRRWLWQRAALYSDTPALREHHFPAFLRGVYPEKFSDVRTVSFRDGDCFYSLKHRISVDTPADLTFMNAVYEQLIKASLDFTLVNAINLLTSNRAIREINDGVYQKVFNEASHRVLFISDPDGGSCAVIHSLKVAGDLVHYHGIGAGFLVFNEGTASIVNERGYKAIIGTRHDILKYGINYSALVFDKFKYYTIQIPHKDSAGADAGAENYYQMDIDIGAGAEAIAADIAKHIKR
ncbi:MAG: NTP transferase domain-containing protein [Nitrospirae bacterium]|nr:NTP transferase domain-containing protein [Nitrospirota bacterium]